MSTIKKQQHYVWKNYLKPWSNDGKIWTFFKKLDKIEQPNLMGVAQEKYFYKLIDFSEDEEVFLKLFIEEISHPSVKDLNLDFLAMFTISNKLKKSLAQNSYTQPNIAYFEEEIRKIEINSMEDTHCKMEELGTKLINYRSIQDLETILQDDYHHDAIIFLCIQYMRTKKIKSSISLRFKGGKHEELMEKSWNILSYAFATSLAAKISLNENLKFVFIENESENNFITGDQPVFNILNGKVNEKGEVLDFELYYPLTPKYALNIHFRIDQTSQFEVKLADNKMIDYLNKRVFESSEFYIFSDTEKQLERLKNNWL